MDDDSPKVVLFTDQQWDDIASFCCDDIDGHKPVLYLSAGLVICACNIITKHHALYEEFQSPRMPGSFGAHHVVYAEG